MPQFDLPIYAYYRALTGNLPYMIAEDGTVLTCMVSPKGVVAATNLTFFTTIVFFHLGYQLMDYIIRHSDLSSPTFVKCRHLDIDWSSIDYAEFQNAMVCTATTDTYLAEIITKLTVLKSKAHTGDMPPPEELQEMLSQAIYKLHLAKIKNLEVLKTLQKMWFEGNIKQLEDDINFNNRLQQELLVSKWEAECNMIKEVRLIESLGLGDVESVTDTDLLNPYANIHPVIKDMYEMSGIQVHGDAASDWQVTFQDPATPVMEGIIHLNTHVWFYLTIIMVVVFWMLFKTITLFSAKNNPKPILFEDSTALEIIWTIIPSLVLLAIGIPSFSLIYSMDELIDPGMTLKVIGHQWFWSYEYSDYNTEDGSSLAFDSYIVPEEDLEEGQLRLLEVDNRVVVPINTHIRVLVTAADVLHAWAVPSFGVKMDCVPGRLNQTSMFIQREGVFYGQCSELCGVNHGFMPIVVEAVSLDKYLTWVSNEIEVTEAQ